MDYYKIDIGFVILHYNAMAETKQLIESIKANIDTELYRIVVVDNASPNKTGVELLKAYENEIYVDVVLLEKNLGFANGNNIGIDYIRKTYFPLFVCCLNNDTILIQKKFFQIINKEYVRSGAAVIGPRIKLRDGSLQRSAYELLAIDYYKNEIIRLEEGFLENKTTKNSIKQKFNTVAPNLYRFILQIWYMFFKPGLLFRKEGKALHGCCLIFTPCFFERLNGFDNRTFLFKEEELLFLHLKENGLLSVYCPRLVIKHLEDVATNSINKSSEEKKKFLIQNQLKSTRILVCEYNKYLANYNSQKDKGKTT